MKETYYSPELKERTQDMSVNTTERAIAKLLKLGFKSDQPDWSILVRLAKSGVPIAAPTRSKN